MGCGSCGENSKGFKIRCDECWLYFHLECVGLEDYPEEGTSWACLKCTKKQKAEKERDDVLKEIIAGNALLARRQAVQSLPFFDGDPRLWPRFKWTFEESCKEGAFSDCANATRILEALGKRPKDLVGNKLLFPGGVTQAMLDMEKAYGQKNVIFDLLVSDIMEAKNPKDRDTFIEFSNRVSNLVLNMKLMKWEHRCQDSRLIGDILVNKFTQAQQEKWIEFIGDRNDADLRNFEDFLKKRVEVLQKLRVKPAVTASTSSKPATSSSIRGNVHVLDDSANEKPIACYICKSKDHKVYKCPDFEAMSISTRWERVKELKLCFGCLGKATHHMRNCHAARTCNIDGCRRKHSRLLHSKPSNAPSSSSQNGAPKPTGEASKRDNEKGELHGAIVSPEMSVSGTNLTLSSNGQSFFLIVPIVAYSHGVEIECHAFLDYGSAFTLIDAQLARELKLSGTPEGFTMICAKGNLVSENKSFRTSFDVSGSNRIKKFSVENVRTVENLGLPTSSLDAEDLKKKYPHLRSVPLPTFKNVKPLMLIGINNPQLLAYHQIIEGPVGAPIAVKTKFSWCIYGKTKGPQVESGNVGLLLHINDSHQEDAALHDLVKHHFTTESFGCRPITNELKSAEEKRVEKIVESTLKEIGGRYEVGLLWKADDVLLPNSYSMAYKRMLFTENRMRKDPDLAQWYVNQIADYVKKGYARKLEPDEVEAANGQSWYIPYFHVVNPNKLPLKRRLIFDAAAKVGKVSLNSNLLTGPNTYVTLPSVIFKSREGNICVAADIKEMFPQVKIRKEDQNYQRFLFRGGDTSRKPEVYVMTSMIFGAACSPYLAQTVKNRNALKFEKKFPEAVHAIVNQHYVDDYLNSHHSVEEAATIANQIIKIHSGAGYDLRNFVSNEPEVLKLLPQSGETVKEVCLNFERENLTEKILGLFWNVADDCYEIRINPNKIPPDVLSFKRAPTKRELLRIVMSIFDPIGLLSHALIPSKVLIQETWRSNIGWDSRLSPLLFEKWKNWFQKFQKLNSIRIPRAYVRDANTATKIDMHVFVDASESAFASVVYFRFEFEDRVELSLVTSKAKVAPTKVLSIPRLELQAALLGARLAQSVKCEHRLKIDHQFFWSDSKTVLAWILSADPQKFKSFVAVRIGEILELTDAREWRKIPTKLNVADDATKWTIETAYHEKSRWFDGPEFLKQPESDWPDCQMNDLSGCEEEVKNPVYLMSDSPYSFEDVPAEKFGKFQKLLSVMACVCKFIRVCREKMGKEERQVKHLERLSKKLKPQAILSVLDFQNAEAKLIQKAQFEAFKEDYVALLNGQELPKKSTLIPLSPYIDDGKIIRISSRIKATPGIPYDNLRPAILPNKHVVTELIVKQHHERFCHQFQEAVISALRTKFWIIHVRSAVRRVKSNCQKCKNDRARPPIIQMGELPLCRLDWGKKPFYHTGLDMFGPMHCTVFRRRIKVWGVLFTCMVTRAIHLDLVKSLSTDACIMSIRNFLNRHGPVYHLYCDNATNFHGSQRELMEQLELKNAELSSANNDYFIEWHFNPPGGSNFGGAYERQIQSVQKALASVLNDQAPQEDTLRSALIECENIVNARPLTHVPIESTDEDPITPNHFLKGHPNCLPAPCVTDGQVDLRKQWRICQQIAENFWKRWRLEILPELARRTKWYQGQPNIAVDDVVIIMDNNLPRNSWRKGRIVKLFEGPDKIPRVALVSSNNKIYKRPLNKLAKLDVKRD